MLSTRGLWAAKGVLSAELWGLDLPLANYDHGRDHNTGMGDSGPVHTAPQSLCLHADMGQLYFTTKHDQYGVSSGQNRWLLCPLVPEDIMKFSVMPSGKNILLIKDQCSDFHDFCFQKYQKNDPNSDLHDKICGNHFYTYIWLIIPFSTEKVKHSHLK